MAMVTSCRGKQCLSCLRTQWSHASDDPDNEVAFIEVTQRKMGRRWVKNHQETMKTRQNEGISHDVSMIFPHVHREKIWRKLHRKSKLEGKLKMIQLESHDFWVVFWDETIFWDSNPE